MCLDWAVEFPAVDPGSVKAQDLPANISVKGLEPMDESNTDEEDGTKGGAK